MTNRWVLKCKYLCCHFSHHQKIQRKKNMKRRKVPRKMIYLKHLFMFSPWNKIFYIQIHSKYKKTKYNKTSSILGNIYSQYTINIIKIMMIHLLYLFALFIYFFVFFVLLGYLFFPLKNMEKHFLYKQIPMKTKCFSDTKQPKNNIYIYRIKYTLYR